MTTITIIGGGFGGVKAALELAKNPDVQVTLITDRPEFQYYPTLYSSATGHSHAESWAPLGEIFADHTNVHVYIDSITRVNADAKTVTGASDAVYHYETLIMAVGVVTTYFGIPGLETYAYGIKTHDEIQKLKQRLFIDIAEKGLLDKNYVVIGAGPTGVELSAAIGTYIQRLCRHYDVKNHSIRVRLIEAAPRVMPRSSEVTSRKVERRLRKLGVDVETNKRVEKENATELIVSGRPIESHTVIWTSGVTNHPLYAAHPAVFTLAKNGRVQVDEYMMAHKDIYVIGDNAATPYTGLAQTAIHDALFVARNIERSLRRKKMRRYHAVQPVSAVPVGVHWAVIEWRWIRIYGFLGGMMRRVADLIGYYDVFPLGLALGSWRAAMVFENDYFTPTLKRVKRRR
ncbi:MAG: NAD(P)/FAD-dependent oxidoreductase [Candidatus Saccharimonadales bacterium]